MWFRHTVGMRRSLRFVLAWLGATLVAVLIATAAVGSVRTQVTETPTQLSSAAATALVTTTVAVSDNQSTTTVRESTNTSTSHPPDIEPTVTAPSDSHVTTTAATTDSVPPTTIPAAPSTTVPQVPSKTITTAAGSVHIVVSGSSVTFAGAYPNPGWKVELEEKGPETVKVKFERNEGEGQIEVTARVDEGELKVDIDDHGDREGDDH